jgi:hypothetical protein
MQQYNYKRELKGTTNAWHKVILPEGLYKNVVPNLSDIRIFGITAAHDTIEAPYILHLKSETSETTQVDFKTLNTSYNEKGYYVTLEVPTQKPINKLQLAFNQFNFDWRVALEGSNDQNEWFTIVDDYRILSIKNAEIFYEYSTIVFPDSKYRFFRILIKSDEKPELKLVKASETKIENGVLQNCVIKTMTLDQNKEEKYTDINIELSKVVPVSYIKIDVNGDYDYYRPVTMEYVSDSTKTENGYYYTYRTLSYGTLNSVEKNVFKFKTALAKKIKIHIKNQDNQPLKIDAVTIKGYVYELLVRFTEPADYYLTYGNPSAYMPNYDIARFASKIPDTLTALNLGEEQIIEKEPVHIKKPLFENKLWLWGIIIAIIVLLGGFSLKMMRSK